MNHFILENVTKTYFGKGCIKEYLTCLVRHYGEHIMFAYGRDSIRKNGVYDEIIESLSKAKKNVIEFSGICENPTYEKVLEGAKLARENNVDFIFAVGGGAAAGATLRKSGRKRKTRRRRMRRRRLADRMRYRKNRKRKASRNSRCRTVQKYRRKIPDSRPQRVGKHW